MEPIKLLHTLSMCTILSSCLPLALSERPHPPRLLLITMDSLMFKFLEDVPSESIEHFNYVIRNGVLLKQMMNVFPSSTFPNHYTLLTGLYPESHGLVMNRFYDPVLNDDFDLYDASDNYDTRWFDVGAEPIYVTNSKAGRERRSGSLLFPTGLANVKGVGPDRSIKDDGTYGGPYPFVNMTFTDRVDRIIAWFTDAREPINLGLLYFPEPDEVSHEFGPESKEVKDVITGVLNNVLGYLIEKLKQHDLMENTNVILTADHGQTSVKRFIRLTDYLDLNKLTIAGHLPIGIYPKEGYENEILQNLTGVQDITVMRKGSAEMRSLHFNNNIRIAPIILIGTEGTIIVKDEEGEKNFHDKGVHGYTPQTVPSMKPLFMAMGPDFKKGFVSKQFSSVDVYPLMCHLLGVTPAPNNGSLDNVRHLLALQTGSANVVSSQAWIIEGLFVLCSCIIQTVHGI